MKWLGAALVLAACGRSGVVYEEDAGAVPAATDAGTNVDAGASTDAPSCSDKIRFTQSAGCQNDGAIELCALDDAATADLLGRLAPGLYRVGTPGCLKCAAPQTAYLLPLAPQDEWCVSFHGPMTPYAWSEMCALAARPEVSAIAAWWAE